MAHIEPNINKEKVVRFFFGQHSGSSWLQEIIESGDYSAFDMDDLYYGFGFENLADVLTHCDETDSIIFGSDGEGEWYFYYPPSMPWHHTSTEPKTEHEVINRIVAAVQKITDMSTEEIVRHIDTELYVLGTG